MSVIANQSYDKRQTPIKSYGKRAVFLALFFTFALHSIPLFSQEAELEPELPPEERAEQHYNRALELKDEAASDPLKETEMLAEYDLCLKLDPNYFDAYIKIGEHHLGKKNYALAEKNFKKASELDATDTTAFDNLGKTYTRLRKYEEAQTAFEAGVDANAEYAGGKKELGKLLYKQKKYKEALVWLGKYNSMVSDDYYSHYLAGKSHKKLNDKTSALKEFQATLKLKNNYANAHYAIGQIHLAQENFGMAIAAYQKSVMYNPKGYRAFYNLAIAIQSNDNDGLDANLAAWKQARKAAKKHPKGKSLLNTINSQIKEIEKQITKKEMNK